MAIQDGSAQFEKKTLTNKEYVDSALQTLINGQDFTVTKTANMGSVTIYYAKRIGNVAIMSFDGGLTTSHGAWQDTDIFTLPFNAYGITNGIGMTNNGIAICLRVKNNKVTHRTLNVTNSDDTIRGTLIFPVIE